MFDTVSIFEIISVFKKGFEQSKDFDCRTAAWTIGHPEISYRDDDEKLTHAEVGHIFCISHSPIANLQHVQIIKTTWLGFRDDEGRFVHDINN